MAPLVGSGLWFGSSSSNGRGIFALGNTTATNIYTYSSNGVTTGTSLAAILYLGAAASSTPGGF